MLELHKLKMRRQGGPHAERLAKHLIVAIQQMLHRVTVSEHTNNGDHNLSATRGVLKPGSSAEKILIFWVGIVKVIWLRRVQNIPIKWPGGVRKFVPVPGGAFLTPPGKGEFWTPLNQMTNTPPNSNPKYEGWSRANCLTGGPFYIGTLITWAENLWLTLVRPINCRPSFTNSLPATGFDSLEDCYF